MKSGGTDLTTTHDPEGQPSGEVDGRAHWSRLYNVPLLMERSRLDPILAADLRNADPSAFMFLFEERPSTLDVRNGIAVLPIKGSLFGFRQKRIEKQFSQAMADPSVHAVLLDVDSPGGQVAGTFDLADKIFEARGQGKVIWAVANDDAFSAAYALGSAADRLFVTRTGGVGSIGVIAVHVEFSKMDERVGLTLTAIFSGARKNDYSDAEPLNAKAHELLQAEVDRLREIFVETVARNRGLKAGAVRGTEAGLFYGPQGPDNDFADGVASFEQVFENLQGELSGRRRVGAQTNTEGTRMDPNDTPAHDHDAAPTADAPPTPEPVADVVSIDTARREGDAAGRAAERERASAIRQACDLAGCPERFGEFCDSDLTPEQVGNQLLEERRAAADPDVRGQHSGIRNGDEWLEPPIDTRAVYHRWNDPQARAAHARREA